MIILFLSSFLLPSILSKEIIQRLFFDDGQEFDWYNVDEDFIKACYSDGGTQVSTYNNIEQIPGSERSLFGIDISQKVLAYQNIITLQAQYQSTQEDKKDKKNKYLYEVAWFIQPFVENVEYSITMLSRNTSIPDITVKETSGADVKVGDSGYWALEVEGKYDYVLVEYIQKGKEYEYNADIKKK